MPYVDEATAEKLSSGAPATTAGQLGYQLGSLIQDFVQNRIEMMGELRFQIITEVMGTLDSISRDFWTKVAEPYETKVEAENDTFHWGFDLTTQNSLVDNGGPQVFPTVEEK